MLVPVNESKEKVEKYEELWSNIRDLFRSIMIMMKKYENQG